MAKITLSDEAYQKLLEAERQLLDQIQEFDRAETCGIDCQNFRLMTSAALERIKQLKIHYAPIGG